MACYIAGVGGSLDGCGKVVESRVECGEPVAEAGQAGGCLGQCGGVAVESYYVYLRECGEKVFAVPAGAKGGVEDDGRVCGGVAEGWCEEFSDSFAQHGDVTMVVSVFHMKAPSMPWCAEVVPQKPQCA